MSNNGENVAKGMPGYRKTLSGGFYTELYTGAAPAPPDAGLPWKVGDSDDNPLSSDPPNVAPPRPDRYIMDLGEKCSGCGAFIASDRGPCSSCSDAARMVTGLTTPATPWF
jgi:hypothetical protein